MTKRSPPVPDQKFAKLYYRIGEASELVGEKPHVLRYWESEFKGLRPQKSSKGQRVYSRRDIDLLLKVKHLLKHQRFTIEGAKQRLREGSVETPAPPEPQPAATPTTALRAALVDLRADVAAFLARLEGTP
ncbi:MAG: MerR family transcriptional regulator [Polyangiaceae bacterium]|nr:MerR family transcriptional regulator [Polyangiaceae bacterium]